MRARASTGAEYHGGGDPGLDRLRTVLGGWRDSLLDMGGRNRLLNFRHTKTSTLEFNSPDAMAILAGLGRGCDFAPVPGASEEADRVPLAKRAPAGSALVTQKTTQSALDAALYRLRQTSAQMYNDFGLWVLWLGVGMLEWREDGAEEANAAPLLLVPVELRRDDRGRPRLHAAEDQERIHNPALAVKLARLGLDWSPVTDTDPADPPVALAAARDFAGTQHRWSVSERVVLGLFASYKEAMYQDLQQNAERILEHPLVRAVALGPEARLPDGLIDFEPLELARIDEIQLPEQIPLVMDADASQRQCIAAASDGRSFVMSGPPGTGKSQTITNMIAALVHAGRSVLFVSEKAAALDVVRNRLRSVGLDDFVMALHSGNTSKKAVATELARVLTTETRATGAAAHELQQARQLREELSAYTAAMNRTRQPLRHTLHDVLGRLALLQQAGTLRLSLQASATPTIRGLSAGALQEITAAAGAVSRAWRPAVEGDAFAWRGLNHPAPQATLDDAAEALAALRAAAERRPFPAAMSEPRTARDVEQVVRTLRSGLPEYGSEPGSDLSDELSDVLAQLADLFGFPKPRTAPDAFSLFELADLASAAVRPPRHWFDPATLRRAHRAADELRQALEALDQARAAAEDVFDERVLAATELPALVRRFAEQHRGLLTRFSAQYKADREAVTALSRGGVWHKSLVERLEQARAWQRAAAEAARLADSHRELLDRYTPRDKDGLLRLNEALATADRICELASDIEHRDLLTTWLADGGEPDRLPALLAHSARGALTDWCLIAAQRARRWAAAANALAELFDGRRGRQLLPGLFGTFDQAQQIVDILRADPLGPAEWHAYRDGLATLNRYRVDDLVARSAECGLAPEQLPAAVEYAVLKVWADDILATDPALRTTRSADLDARVAAFQQADQRLVAAASGAVIEACNARRPRRFNGGAAGVITREAEKKKRHMPVRDLLTRTRDVVRLIKPCFMMSPLTVSQFLPADYQFDVVIFDEASQVRPADAVNCIYRGRALIVAGDDKQLPPTSFFESAVDDDSDDYDEDVPDAFESLLQACKAAAMRELPLRWHYRSRHEDLITFSNREFYENSMVTFPGARDQGDDIGVAFFLAEGVYARGGRRDNRIEAERVAERVIHHFTTRPGATLGVVALSQSQASAIDLAVQQARLRRPDLDHCFTEDRLGGFFVKNLESVQGDERDVMIMSIGYGPDEHGKLGLNFGPINKAGGWRRLNVAVTRARFRMEVVASFHGGQLGDSQNESVQYLKRYLEYAEKGPTVLAQEPVHPDAEPESPFEESVLQTLRNWGYQAQPQVGVAGYRIDIGLRHPAAPGSYALGIECDGAMYHSSKAARDRDRLREQVLNGLGWRLYRIWGTDWYRGREAAEHRLRAAVEEAVAQTPFAAPIPATWPITTAHDSMPPTDAGVAAETAPHHEPRTPETVTAESPRVAVAPAPDRSWSVPYRSCDLEVPMRHIELHTPQARPALRRLVMRVVDVEGPIHEDLLVQRIREAWGVGRAGSRIRDNINQVVRALTREGEIDSTGSFLDVANRTELCARHPGNDPERKVGHVAPVERQRALYELAAECPGMTRDELIRQACDFFGWKRPRQDTRGALEADVAALYRQGRLAGEEDSIVAAR